MKYRDIEPMPRLDAEKALAGGDPAVICDALVRSAFHDPDWKWVQEHCLRLIRHANDDVRGLAVTCLGHIARIHAKMDVVRVKSALLPLTKDPKIAGRVEDALEDIQRYIAG